MAFQKHATYRFHQTAKVTRLMGRVPIFGEILHQNTDARKRIEFLNIVASENSTYHFERACIGYPRPSPGGRVGVHKDRKRELSCSRGVGKRERSGVGWFNHGGYHNP